MSQNNQNEIININLIKKDTSNKEPPKDYYVDTIMNLKFNQENENDFQIDKDKKNLQKKENIDDISHVNLIPNDVLNKLNEPKKEEEKVPEQKKGFFQSGKSWINKTWNSIKNYDYSKLNIFKQEEMEECLDAHGFPIKIPKKKHKTKPNKEEEK